MKKRRPGLGKLVSEIFGKDWVERGWKKGPSIAEVTSISDIRENHTTSSAPSIAAIKRSFKNHLLRTPIFKNEKDRIVFYDIEHQRIMPKVDVEGLLDAVTEELYKLFDSYLEETHDDLKVDRLLYESIIDNLHRNRHKFIAAGVREESYDVTVKKITGWINKVSNHVIRKFTLIDGRKLIEPLFVVFEEHAPRLTKGGIQLSIACILKEFILETGSTKQIYERIKTYTRRKKT